MVRFEARDLKIYRKLRYAISYLCRFSYGMTYMAEIMKVIHSSLTFA